MTKCWSWPFVLCLLYFNLVIGCKIWCLSEVRILRRLICNLGCVHILLLVPNLLVCKWVLLMSLLTGDLGSRWMGRWNLLYDIYVCWRLLPAPHNCFHPENKGILSKVFHDFGLCSFSCQSHLLDLSRNLVSWYSENIFYLICSSSWSNAWLSFLMFWWSVALISKNLKGCWFSWKQDSI